MPHPETDLHHDRGDESPVALLLVDVINPLDFDGAEALLERARPAAAAIRAFAARARAAGVPVVYANDNFGRWRSDMPALVARCLEPDCLGRELVKGLQPEPEDYFVLKPQLSAFHDTTLRTLLRHLRVRTVIVGGFAGDRCVLFSAADAHMDSFRVLAPHDLFASEAEAYDAQARALLERAVQADTRPSTELDLADLTSA